MERGPLVYCAEAADNGGASVLRAVMNARPSFMEVNDYAIANTETKGAPSFVVKALQTQAQVLGENADGTISVSPLSLTLIPYYAWNHRGANEMNVWLLQGLKAMDR